MKHIIFISALLVATTCLAAADNPSPTTDKLVYTTTQYIVERPDTKNLIAVIKFEAKPGWKWNESYPSKFVMKKGASGKLPYKLLAHHVEHGDKEELPQVWMELEPSVYAKVTRQKFTVTAKYSFCNETSCLVFHRDVRF